MCVLGPEPEADTTNAPHAGKGRQDAIAPTPENGKRRSRNFCPQLDRQSDPQDERKGIRNHSYDADSQVAEHRPSTEMTATSSRETEAAQATPYMALLARMREQPENDESSKPPNALGEQERGHGSAEPSTLQEQEHGDVPTRSGTKRKRPPRHPIEREVDRRRKSFLSDLITQTMRTRDTQVGGKASGPANEQPSEASRETSQQAAQLPNNQDAKAAKETRTRRRQKQNAKEPEAMMGSEDTGAKDGQHDELSQADTNGKAPEKSQGIHSELVMRPLSVNESKATPASQQRTSSLQKPYMSSSIPRHDATSSQPVHGPGASAYAEIWSGPTMRAMEEASRSPWAGELSAPRPLHASAKPVGSPGRRAQPLVREPSVPSLTSSPARRKTTRTMSQFFRKEDAENVSCLTFPSLKASAFGLVQERLARQPFQLLVAVILLNKTRGSVAVPACDRLFDLYPSAVHMAKASVDDIIRVIGNLGLQQKRAQTILDLARTWLQNRPQRGKRYRLLNYPHPGSGRNISNKEEPIAEEDPREAWEVIHLPGIGAYGVDSWRIFCRDALRQRASGMLPLGADGAAAIELEQEWTAVLPKDKELRAYLQWRWLRLGFLWDPQSGDKVRTGPDVIAKLERKELKSYFGFKNPWLMDFMITEETPDFALDGLSTTHTGGSFDQENLHPHNGRSKLELGQGSSKENPSDGQI